MTDRSADPDEPESDLAAAERLLEMAQNGCHRHEFNRAFYSFLQKRDPVAKRDGDTDQLLAKGWHLSCYSYVKPGAAREYRLLLVNGSLDRKLFGFGKDFAEALANAAGQV